MRVSTQGAYLSGLTMMQRLQTALDFTQRQISSGRRVLTPSDDPIAASRALEIRESIGRLEQFDRNSNIATNRLAQEESSLNSVNNVLQRVRELALQANNGSQSDETRKLIAVEIREQLDQLVQLANQKDGNGSYLFSGNLEDTLPVTRAGSSFVYNGDQGQRYIQIGEGRQVPDGDPGSAVFFTNRQGNGTFVAVPSPVNTGSGVLGAGSLVDPAVWDQGRYSVRFLDQDNYQVRNSASVLVASGAFEPGDTIAFQGIEISIDGQPEGGDQFNFAASGLQSVFESVDQIATALEQNVGDDVARAELNNQVNFGLLNVDQAIGNILDVRTQIGSRLSAIEEQVDSNGSFALSYQETLASIEDLDYAEALSRLSLEATTLEAAQQSFIRTQSLSLFNYL
ncbi:MAG: flagellar hook-associated protein FlgL [Gammaproteobacteria bacterium]|nr:flagellar hook-associated protein FlgL [Gammaproteobacteria bacterium]